VGTGQSLPDASLSASVDRKDRHKVAMGFAIAGRGVSLVGPLSFATPPVSLIALTAGEENTAAAVKSVPYAQDLRANRGRHTVKLKESAVAERAKAKKAKAAVSRARPTRAGPPDLSTGGTDLHVGLHDVVRALKTIEEYGQMSKFVRAAK
jgi:hypothetical protein